MESWPTYGAFRAARPGVPDAVATCERLDWLVKIAWEEASDRKKALRLVSSTAWMFAPGGEWRQLGRDLCDIVVPYPSRREIIDTFAGNVGEEDARVRDNVRAICVATEISGVLVASAAYVADRHPHAGIVYTVSFLSVMAVGAAVLAPFVKRGVAAISRSKVAALEENLVIDLAFAAIAEGIERRPDVAALLLGPSRRHVRELLGIPAPPKS